jgi:hypothetical protein
MKRKPTITITPEVQAIRAKIEAGERLTAKERRKEVAKEEAAYLLTAIARRSDPSREVKAAYIKQLTREDETHKPRLVASNVVGNSYLYTVESLLQVRFTKAHKEGEETEEAA